MAKMAASPAIRTTYAAQRARASLLTIRHLTVLTAHYRRTYCLSIIIAAKTDVLSRVLI